MSIALADRLISKGMKQEDVSGVVSEMSSYYNRLNLLGRKIHNCDLCPLRQGCSAPVAGLGPLHPEVLVVSDHPLANPESTGMIETSVFMMTMLSKIGLKAEDVYWTHAVKCPTNKITMSHIRECHINLHGEITVLQPAVIIALGSAAISSLAGERVSIDDAIGKVFEFDAGGKDIRVVPIHHPRSLLELPKPEFKEKMRDTWMWIKEIEDYL